MSEDHFRGVPRIESPVFASDALADLTEAERVIAHDLNIRGYAVLDFSDPDIENLIERIKSHLGPLCNIRFDDPAADKTKGKRRNSGRMEIR